jgi:putative Mg2+ transporter-C (MgtC) family protein
LKQLFFVITDGISSGGLLEYPLSQECVFFAVSRYTRPRIRIAAVLGDAHMANLTSVMDAIQQDFQDFSDPVWMARVAVRLFIAALLGGLIGYQRQLNGKSAGSRTHMLVSMGAALFIVGPHLEGMPLEAQSRVVQGIITGIGFLGGGAILKLTNDKEIQGLTTAAGIWLAAAIGIAVGVGHLGTAFVGTGLALLILVLMARIRR